MERGDHGGERIRRIDDRTAVAARVQVNVRVAHIHLHVGDPAKPHGERWKIPLKKSCVADDHGVAAAALRVRRHPALKVDGARLLLALKDVLHVDRQRTPRAEERLKRGEVDDDLSLIVGRAAAEHAAISNDRLEWTRLPKVERVARLHVVVPVDDDRWQLRIFDSLTNNDRVSTRLAHLNALRTNATQFGGEPLRRLAAVSRVFWDRGDARNAQEVNVTLHPSRMCGNDLRLLWATQRRPGERWCVRH